MDKYENTPGVLNISETCAASISIEDLIGLCKDPNTPAPLSSSMKLTYGPIRGSNTLRERIAALYSIDGQPPLPAENVLITNGAIFANFLSFYTLVEPGDHVICVYLTYQQLYAVPASLGAEKNTKLLIINNPNNPTGATIPSSILKEIVQFAKERNIYVLSDEVYRPLFHSLPTQEWPPSMLSYNYPQTLVTGSMSKAYALAGIRIGWIASHSKEIIDSIAASKDYTTISVSQLDDQVASYALGPAVLPSLMHRNMSLARTNLEILASFVEQNAKYCDWEKPNGGTTALVRFKNGDVPVDEGFCLDLLEKTKVMVPPGSKCFGPEFAGFVRIGYVGETEVLKEASGKWRKYLTENFK